MTTALIGILGFATLFAVVGLVPLEAGGCHDGCSAESAADCARCPFAPGGDAEGPFPGGGEGGYG